MVDNLDDNTLDNPINPQSENLSDDIISTNQANTVIPKQETENMEVHAQELHKAPGHGWKHYFFEFFMLFLAVFCGFLAENQREHMVEHEREKQYIKSLEEDIQSDIKQIHQHQTELNPFINRLDSIIDNLSQSYNITPSANCYRQISIGFGFSDFIYNDRTMQQLKNAGGMRLIRNLTVTDSIVAYDETVRRSLVLQEIINTIHLPRMVDKINYLINITEMNKLVSNSYVGIDTINLRKTILLSHDNNELTRFIDELRHYRYIIYYHLEYLTNDSDKATRLLSLLKKEYKIE